MTFQILSGKDEKVGQLPAALVHRNVVAFKVWLQFVQISVEKNTLEPSSKL
jgi:hypothetical protein